MKNKKIKVKLVSILLSIVFTIGFMQPLFQARVVYGADSSAETIDNGKIYNSPFEEEMEEFLNRFDDYECIPKGDSLLVRETNYTISGREVYETRLNYLDDGLSEFNITVKTYDNKSKQEFSEEYTAQLYLDDEEDEYYIVFEGELISVADIIENDVVESRIAGVDDIAVAVAALAVSAVIICYPYVKTVVTTFVCWVQSFWRWLRGIFITKTRTTSVTYYRINIYERDFELEKVETWEDGKYDGDCYYLSVVLGPDVYISVEDVTEGEAVAVLATDTVVSIEGAEFQLNTYTMESLNAKSITVQAATYRGFPEIQDHEYHGGSKKGTYFKHYHPGPNGHRGLPHSFYGVPEIR